MMPLSRVGARHAVPAASAGRAAPVPWCHRCRRGHHAEGPVLRSGSCPSAAAFGERKSSLRPRNGEGEVLWFFYCVFIYPASAGAPRRAAPPPELSWPEEAARRWPQSYPGLNVCTAQQLIRLPFNCEMYVLSSSHFCSEASSWTTGVCREPSRYQERKERTAPRRLDSPAACDEELRPGQQEHAAVLHCLVKWHRLFLKRVQPG